MWASRSLSVLLLLPLVLLRIPPSQVHPGISLTVIPPESTVYVGQTQSFTAVVMGTSEALIKWSVQETNGGSITEGGIYTAPQEIGIYHVVALALSNGLSAQTVARVTVVTHYDTPPN